MKIVFISAANSIHTVRWVNALSELGHCVYLISQINHKNKTNEISEKVRQIYLTVSGFKGYYLNALQLRKKVQEINPDVINVHYASGYGTLMRTARLTNTILSVWGSDVYDFPYKSRLHRKIVQKNLLYANKIASTSHCMARQVRRIIRKNVIITITPFGVDLDKFNPNLYKKRDNKEIIIGNIKTLSSKYGIDYLIKAIRLLMDELNKEEKQYDTKKIRCHIYGEGEQKGELLKLIDKLNLREYVFLKGKIPHTQVPKILSTFDIFCATSIKNSESFGVSVVEAQAMGLPVVVSDVDGFCEVVQDNLTGIIVKNKSVEEIMLGLKKLILDKEISKKIGNNGRKRIEENYNWKKNVKSMIELYKT